MCFLVSQGLKNISHIKLFLKNLGGVYMEKNLKDEIARKILEGENISKICQDYKISMITLLMEMEKKNDVFAKVYCEYKNQHT
jgi:hypothetical protein